MSYVCRRLLGRRIFVCAASVAASVVGLALTPRSAEAVILHRTATRNTSAPTGTNANSGWQWQGNWANGFTGTPISKNHFITAGHVGGGVGQNVWVFGKNYRAVAQYDDPSSDLRIYRIEGSFPSWAPLYTGTSETGKRGMVFGRGTTRGSEVRKGTTLKGWKWGTQDKVRSWGENNVSGTLSDPTYGPLLRFTFDKSGLYNEAALSTGDSGGGVFINDGGAWKLAGINYLVDGPFSLSGTSGSGFHASVLDKGGLYVGGDGAWRYTTDTTADVPGQWYATRISSRQNWIKSIVGTLSAPPALTAVPEPASAAVFAVGATMLLRRRRCCRHSR